MRHNSKVFPEKRFETDMTSLSEPEEMNSNADAAVTFDQDFEDELESESDLSDAESLDGDMVETEAQQQEPNAEDDESKQQKKKRKRKKHDPNKRRKIRKLFTEKKLKTETLEAIRQEEERRRRLEESRIAQLQQNEFMPEFNQSATISNENRFSNTSKSSGIAAASTYLTSLLTSKDELKPCKSFSSNLAPETTTTAQPKSADVICISSDSEEDKRAEQPPNKTDMIDISSDSSDDVICTGEVAEEEGEPEDVNNSGMHIEDVKNQRDNLGRVLVNVNRPSSEPEIFLAPQLAAAILPHQIGGVRFMYDNIVETLTHFDASPGFGCILAHSMGLGKTLQVISFVDIFLRHTKARTVLCVVPVNTLMNWIAEFNMWLPPISKCSDTKPAAVWPRSFTVHILSDNHKSVDSRSKVVTQWYEEGGVLLLGYEMYRQLAGRKQRKRRSRKKSPKPNEPIDVEEEDRLSNLATGMQASLLKPGPDLIICDEGHRIKNSHASISKMLKLVRTKRRIVLTGYPLQNNLLEYWCMVDFVRPNFLGTRQEFSNMFERPILNGQCADSNEGDIKLMRFRSHVLHSLLKGFVQRRSHSVLQQTLPLKEEHVVMIRLSEWQKKLYNTFWETKMKGSSGSWCSTINPIKAFSICIKIWNHPDVLYRSVQEREEENNELDPDFDIPDSIDSAISGKKKRPKTLATSRDMVGLSASLANGDSISSTAPDELPALASSPAAPVAQPPGFNPFSDDKERRMSLEWAKDILSGYTTNLVEISGKMVVLMRIINLSVELGDRLLVFSQSLTTLSLIEEFLSQQYIPKTDPNEPARRWCKNESYFRLDGNTNSGDRERMINQFNSQTNKYIHLFLLSTRAGCLGINLIGANRVVVFDASWNPCHDAQAVCRVYRYGQQKTCHIYRLVSDQCMEKKIYERQVTKQGMSDRVVDKLNPTQVFTKQDVLSLMEYSNDELPTVNFENVEKDYLDPVLIEVCKSVGHWFTKKPFTHESLLLDCKDQRLTKAEKRLAEKGYEKDKMASSAYNYGRQSYAGFYGSSKSNNNIGSNFPPSSQSHDQNRPIANVRPMQSTPIPTQLQGGNPGGPVVHKSGITVQKVVATMDIPLPAQPSTINTTGGGQPTKIHAGDTICVIRGRKGTYIRTSQGRIFAVRLNDTQRFTNAQSEPATRLSHATSMVPSPSSAVNLPSANSTSRSNSTPSSWINLNNMKNTPVITSSANYLPADAPEEESASMYNNSSTMLNNQFMRGSPYNSMPHMQIGPPAAPMHMGPFSNDEFNSMYSNSQPVAQNSDFAAISYYNSSTSASAVSYSRSHSSLASADSIPNRGYGLLASSDSVPNMNPPAYHANSIYSSSSFMNFAKQDSPSVNDSSALRTSYSTPSFSSLPNLQESVPMDLSNPYSSQYSTSQESSMDGTPQSSLDGDGGLGISLPPFNW